MNTHLCFTNSLGLSWSSGNICWRMNLQSMIQPRIAYNYPSRMIIFTFIFKYILNNKIRINMRFFYESKRFLLFNMYLVYNIRDRKCSKVKLTLPSLLCQVGDVRYLCRKLDGIYFLCCITKLPHNHQIKTIYTYYLLVSLSEKFGRASLGSLCKLSQAQSGCWSDSGHISRFSWGRLAPKLMYLW